MTNLTITVSCNPEETIQKLAAYTERDLSGIKLSTDLFTYKEDLETGYTADLDSITTELATQIVDAVNLALAAEEDIDSHSINQDLFGVYHQDSNFAIEFESDHDGMTTILYKIRDQRASDKRWEVRLDNAIMGYLENGYGYILAYDNSLLPSDLDALELEVECVTDLKAYKVEQLEEVLTEAHQAGVPKHCIDIEALYQHHFCNHPLFSGETEGEFWKVESR